MGLSHHGATQTDAAATIGLTSAGECRASIGYERFPARPKLKRRFVGIVDEVTRRVDLTLQVYRRRRLVGGVLLNYKCYHKARRADGGLRMSIRL